MSFYNTYVSDVEIFTTNAVKKTEKKHAVSPKTFNIYHVKQICKILLLITIFKTTKELVTLLSWR